MLNTETKIIKKSIGISAAKEKVWDVLLLDNLTRIWYAEFSEGTHAETDWQLGSKVTFTDNSHSGLVGTVAVNRPCEVISVEYTGVVENGEEIYDSEIAKSVQGGRETYRLVEKEDMIYLSVECDMSEEYFDMMSAAWDKALEKIKELAEK